MEASASGGLLDNCQAIYPRLQPQARLRLRSFLALARASACIAEISMATGQSAHIMVPGARRAGLPPLAANVLAGHCERALTIAPKRYGKGQKNRGRRGEAI